MACRYFVADDAQRISIIALFPAGKRIIFYGSGRVSRTSINLLRLWLSGSREAARHTYTDMVRKHNVDVSVLVKLLFKEKLGNRYKLQLYFHKQCEHDVHVNHRRLKILKIVSLTYTYSIYLYTYVACNGKSPISDK